MSEEPNQLITDQQSRLLTNQQNQLVTKHYRVEVTEFDCDDESSSAATSDVGELDEIVSGA